MKNVRGIAEKELTWVEFENIFSEQYLSEHYYDGKRKEFYELKMGQLSDDEYATKFIELLRYFPYLKDENVKIQKFISGLPIKFIHKIELLEPPTMKDVIKNMRHYYEQKNAG